MVVSSDLTWSKHHNLITGRAYRQLGLLRRTFANVRSTAEKKKLYLSLVRSQMMYCSIWCLHLTKDILKLEKVQRRATQIILNDYISDYFTRLKSLNMLPLMYQLEINDIMFCVKNLKYPTDVFPLTNYSVVML